MHINVANTRAKLGLLIRELTLCLFQKLLVFLDAHFRRFELFGNDVIVRLGFLHIRRKLAKLLRNRTDTLAQSVRMCLLFLRLSLQIFEL